jgi:surface carbohydrate biosynthesis protein
MKIFYMMVEVSSRELLAKILLAVTLCRKDFVVVLGSQRVIRGILASIPSAPVGGFLENGLNEERYDRLKDLRNRGFSIFSLCEESTAYLDFETYCDERLDAKCFAICDQAFLLGEQVFHSVLKNRSEFIDRVTLSGNPRFDLLFSPLRRLYHSEAVRLTEQFGRYILFNSSLSCNLHPYEQQIGGLEEFCTSFVGSSRVENARRRRVAHDRRYFQYLEGIFGAYCRELDRLRLSLVIRPHPSEDLSPWEELAQPFKNVYVCNKGDVRPWLIGAMGVIQNHCTTAIESFILGRSVFALLPAFSSDYLMQEGFSLPNFVADRSGEYVDLVDWTVGLVKGELDKYLVESSGNDLKRSMISKYFRTPLDGRSITASQIIASSIEQLTASMVGDCGCQSLIGMMQGVILESQKSTSLYCQIFGQRDPLAQTALRGFNEDAVLRAVQHVSKLTCGAPVLCSRVENDLYLFHS